MTRNTFVWAVLGVLLLLTAVAPLASAHDWQTTTSDGPFELGVSTSPETPVAGMETSFSARVADANHTGDENRTSWGGVTNKSVTVHIRGPDGYHDHLTTDIPEDGAHFHWSYVFPTNGTYEIGPEMTLEGEDHRLNFNRTVVLLPTEARGDQVQEVGQDVDELREDVDDLQAAVDQLQDQLADHGDASGDHRSNAETPQENSIPGLGVQAALGALVAAGAYALGKRQG